MKRGILFVTGIHGVGKTTLCEYLSASLGLPSFSASSIIKRFSNRKSLPEKLNVDIFRNADIFRTAIPILAQTNPTFLVDGHTVLLDQNACFVRIPAAIFKDLPIIAFVLLYHDIEELKRRSKENIPNDHSFIASFQNAEIMQASIVARELGIDILVWHGSDDYSSISAKLKNILE